MDFKTDTRGFRNNNPGNIRHGNNWQGEKPGNDSQFETFVSVEYGIRAIHVLLDTFARHYGLITIEDIITRYAPPHENHTVNYINAVYNYLYNNTTPTQFVYIDKMKAESDIHKHDLKPVFIGGLILVENGFQPFNFEFIQECENVCDS